MDLLSGNIHYKKIEDKDVDKLVFGFLATPLYFYEIEDLKGREELGYFDFFENVKKITNLILSCEFSNGYSGDFGGLSREEYWGAFASTVERPDAIIFIEKGCGVKMANNDNKYDQAKGLLLEITSYLCEEFGGWFDLDKKYFELSGYHF